MSQPDPRPFLFDAVCALLKAHGKVEALVDEYREAGDSSAAATAALELDRIEEAIQGLKSLHR